MNKIGIIVNPLKDPGLLYLNEVARRLEKRILLMRFPAVIMNPKKNIRFVPQRNVSWEPGLF